MTEDILRSLASAVFEERCGIGIVRVGSVEPQALPRDEQQAIQAAIPTRAREFAAGRCAARKAMAWQGVLPMGPDRAPIWPAGWFGSISHSQGWAIAVARTTRGMIGVDLEGDGDLPEDIVPEVLTPAETRFCAGNLRLARRLFAIKEAAYKAQYPESRTVFDFHTLEVTLDPGRFLARFQRTVGPFAEGAIIRGRWASGGGMVLAGVLD